MAKKTAWVCLFILGAAITTGSQTVDCLVAVVDGQALTLIDLQIAREFGLFDREIRGKAGDPKVLVLDALVNLKVVLEVTRELRPVDKAESEAALASLRDSVGPEAFQVKLKKFGLKENDLLPYLEDKIRFERAVAARFNQEIPVTRSAVEKFYLEVYAPERKAQGLEPEPLSDLVAGLEARLRASVKDTQKSEWIKNIRAQAGIRINTDCLK